MDWKKVSAVAGVGLVGFGGLGMLMKPLAVTMPNAGLYFTPAALAQSAAQVAVIHKIGFIVLAVGAVVLVGVGVGYLTARKK